MVPSPWQAKQIFSPGPGLAGCAGIGADADADALLVVAGA
jgi:hypothetical protein